MLARISALFILFFLLFTESAEAGEQKEWILYFQSIEGADRFAANEQEHILNQDGRIIKAQYFEGELPQIKEQLLKIEPNYPKSSAADSIINDPSYSLQWGLKSIHFDKVFSSFNTVQNLVAGKMITNGNEQFTYQKTPFSSTDFSIQLGQDRLSRLSVELELIEGPWTLSVYDSTGKLITKNEGELQRLDVVLPKDTTLHTIQVKIEPKQTWSKKPIILEVTGVNHLLIAVIDSGVSIHEDFCSNILYSLGKDYVENLKWPEDLFGHGTHVTGILAACTNNQKGGTGVLGDADVDILPLKVLNKRGMGDDFEIALAIKDAIEAGAEIINLSLAGRGETSILKETIAEAVQKNILIISAAGNWNILTDKVYPASYDGVIAVSSTTPSMTKVPSSNFGWEVDISAPGQAIYSTFLNNSYSNMTGTSMATPFVTGAAALIKLNNPNYDAIKVRNTLIHSATDLSIKGYDIETGYGLLNLQNAMQTMDTSSLSWLSLNNGQPLNKLKEQILGVSTTLAGKQLLVFANETELYAAPALPLRNPISFSEYDANKKYTRIFSLILDKNENILDSNYINVSHPDITDTIAFSDVHSNHWAYLDIIKGAEIGLINGYESGKFQPNSPITRKHTTMMLNRLFQWELSGPSKSPFSDVTKSLKMDYLSLLVAFNQGVINGYKDGTFKPNNPLTRGQMALIIARSLEPDGFTFTGQPYPFKDIKNGEEIYQAVQLLAERGIITKQDYFRPLESITRAQFTTMLMRTYKYIH
ncbi:S8 family peptidase [Peribacillus sp. JNUCC 23]